MNPAGACILGLVIAALAVPAARAGDITTGTAVAQSPANSTNSNTVDDDVRTALVRGVNLGYRGVARRLQLDMEPGSAAWQRSVEASVDAIFAVMPDGCSGLSLVLRLCGMRSVYAVATAMWPTVRWNEALLTVPYSDDRRVERGDIVVFTVPDASGGRTQYLFRVIGLPGEEIVLRNGVVHVDGTPLRQEATSERVPAVPDLSIGDRELEVRVETTPEGRRYRITHEDGYRLNDAGPFRVPADTLFVLGDNRPNSADSRAPNFAFGPFVPMSAISGRVAIVYISRDRARIGTRLDPQRARP